jgi:23S rRNA U2552 (ribose-2'-O)-methylase RlmE/FtsJ
LGIAPDHLRTMALLDAAMDVAEAVLKPGGAFVARCSTAALPARFSPISEHVS